VCLALLAALSVTTALPGSAASVSRVELVEDTGVIHAIDYGRNQMIIDGVRFSVSAGARIRIRGDTGTFTGLVKGMKVSYVFENRSRTNRVIMVLEQLPDNTIIERN
jgi:hypothetical protein